MADAHTPGKWKVLKGAAEGDDMRCAVVVEQGKMQYLLATIENGAPGDFCETEEANAALIASAPTLLAERDRLKEINAELVAALNSINCVTSPGSRTLDDFVRDMGLACDVARGAIAKARNQTPVAGE